MLVEVEKMFDYCQEHDGVLDFLYDLYEKLSKDERDKMEQECFGIAATRSYPMPDSKHVMYAIRMFNFCKPSNEKQLAINIIKFIEKFKINPATVKVGQTNRFYKYWSEYLTVGLIN